MTVTVNERVVVLLVGWPSLIVTVIVAEPKVLVSGVKLRVAAGFGLAYATTGVGIRLGLLELADSVRVCVSLIEPAPIPDNEMVCVLEFSFNTTSAIGSSVGG